MTPSLLDAYELLAHSEKLLARLEAARLELSKKQGLRDEKAWLGQACDRVAKARDGVSDLAVRALRLSDLDELRADAARSLQHAAVDAVEKLHAGITFAAGSRAPLLEALYGRLKLPLLRKLDREDFEKFCTDFEKRLNSGYARRMFAEEGYAVVVPVLDTLRQAVATWRGVFSEEVLDEDGARLLRDELEVTAARLELPMRQARLLAEAALAPLRELPEAAQVPPKPRKRVKKPGEDAAALDVPAVDPHAPDETELAELAG